jgi:hypothetical protein
MNVTRFVRLSIMSAAILVSLPAITAAQSGFTGVVRDTTGAVLPGVTVEASSPALIEKTRTGLTDAQGVYRIVDLRPGVYVVTFVLPGFSTVRREGLDLPASFMATVNAELRVGALEETVTVSGQAPVVDVSNVAQQTVMARDTIDAIPVARIATALSALLPGVQTLGLGDPVGRQQLSFAIHGSRPGEQSTTIDGFSNRLALGVGGTTSTFYNNQATVQETTVTTGGGLAEQQFSGIWTNLIPKEGGNTFTAHLFTAFANESLANSNLTDELRDRGIQDVAGLKKLWDFNPAVGGRILRDRMWFYGSYRHSGVSQYRAGIYYNLTPTAWTYTPDLDRPAFVEVTDGSYSTRVTWQVTPRNKLSLYYDMQPHVVTHRNFDAVTSPEATNYTPYIPNYFTQAVWKSPVTSRLLLEAGVGGTSIDYNARLQTGQDPLVVVVPGTVSAVESSTGMRFRAPAAGQVDQAPGSRANNQATFRGSATYVTGSHAFKTGFNLVRASTIDRFNDYSGDLSVTLLNGVPRSLTLAAVPAVLGRRIRPDLGIYVQDQWTIRQLTLNLGVRYDHQRNETDPVDLPAGRFVPARSFEGVKNVPNWHDISPRFGASFDVFGDGRTAVKVSLNRYVAGHGTGGVTLAMHPVTRSIVSVNRNWTDTDGDFVPDCDLANPLLNGECAQISNLNFGRNNPNATQYDPDVLEGWGVRGYNWETSASVQRELTSGVSANVGYFRRWYGNFTATDNLLVTPADYDPFCITAPADPRLPGGGGNEICGYYDVTPSKFGQSEEFITLATEDFGRRTEIYNGVDMTVNARLGGGASVSGGVSIGRVATNNCEVIDSPESALFCDVTPPFQPNIKFMGVYPLPWWGIQIAGALQNVPGAEITANYVARNSEIAPTLGRNLASGANGTRTLPLIQPGTLYEDRQTQLDFRATKRFTLGGTRILGSLDVFNILNVAGIDAINNAYGPNWLRPTRIQGTRYVKFSAQLDF